jgi:hypothetical protein
MLRKIKCLMNSYTLGQIRKPLLYPFELWGRNPSKYGLLRLCAANHAGHILLG